MISLALVTYNRGNIVAESLGNVLASGAVREVVWVDNGSDPAEILTIRGALEHARVPFTSVLVHENRGAGWALNRAFALAKRSIILVTDGDVRLDQADVWRMLHVLQAEEKRLAVAIYPREPDTVPERYRGPRFEEVIRIGPRAGERLVLARGLPMLCPLFKRELLGVAGWMREDFGPCEWNDNEWAERAMYHATREGFELLALADRSCVHIPDEDRSRQSPEYWAMLVREFEDRSKPARILELAQAGYPKFTPWPG